MSHPERSRRARELAERALVRLVKAYGETPAFVLLGGLVPDLLCGNATHMHVGTTDVDVQVDLEIQSGSENAARLERALNNADFHPDAERSWRWRDEEAPELVVKVEFLADQEDIGNHLTFDFKDCKRLGAINLRGTGFAARDWELRSVTAAIAGTSTTVEVRVASLPAYLLAKAHAAYGRSFEKDWYDISYVLLHNDEGGPRAAARQVRLRFGTELVGATATAIGELSANFADSAAQGSQAYASTMLGIYPEMDWDLLLNDAVDAVSEFVDALNVES